MIGAGSLRRLRLATRGSALALAQARLAIDALRASGLVEEVEVVIVRTRGDSSGAPVHLLQGQGWFSAEVEAAVVEGRADCAVHSAKDLPTTLAPGLVVAAYLPRGDVRDALVTRDGSTLGALPRGATIGTGSPRREAMLAALRADLRCVPLRGNVDTRLRRLDDGAIDGLVLAAAGLDRLGLGERAAERFDPRVVVPAPAQGAIALECHADGPVAAVCRAIDDEATSAAVTAERAVLRGVGGGCRQALGAWARLAEDGLRLVAALGTTEGVVRVELEGPVREAASLGADAARRLQQGAT